MKRRHVALDRRVLEGRTWGRVKLNRRDAAEWQARRDPRRGTRTGGAARTAPGLGRPTRDPITYYISTAYEFRDRN